MVPFSFFSFFPACIRGDVRKKRGSSSLSSVLYDKNPTSVFPKNYINEQFSYPSGHAARAIFIGIVLLGVYWYKQCKNGAILTIKSLMTPKTLLVVCLVALYVMLVAVSRIYIGHHWFSDIFGGVLLGSGFGLLALAFILPDPYNTKYMNS